MKIDVKLAGLISCVAVSLAGCSEPAPSGQVVATANGEEITIDELRAEATARDRTNMDGITVQSDLLRDIIDRKLLVQEAKREKLDQEVQYVLSRRRAEEALLADFEVQTVRNSVPTPTSANIDQFLTNNPKAFAVKTVFRIEQTTVRPEGDTVLTKKLTDAKSLDEVDAILKGSGVIGQRSETDWSSMFMPVSLVAKINGKTEGGLFFIQNGENLIVAKLISKSEVAVDDIDRRKLVREQILQQKIKIAIAEQMDNLRTSAKIRVQPGFKISEPIP